MLFLGHAQKQRGLKLWDASSGARGAQCFFLRASSGGWGTQ